MELLKPRFSFLENDIYIAPFFLTSVNIILFNLLGRKSVLLKF